MLDGVNVQNDPVNLVDPLGLDAVTTFLPFGKSFSFHIPFTQYAPGEDIHERQHREDWAKYPNMPGWEMEQRAFAAEAEYLRNRINEFQHKCNTNVDEKELQELQTALTVAETIAESEPAAKSYWNETGRRWWQQKERVIWK